MKVVSWFLPSFYHFVSKWVVRFHRVAVVITVGVTLGFKWNTIISHCPNVFRPITAFKLANKSPLYSRFEIANRDFPA